MQGFAKMLATMGIDPQKMAEEAVTQFGPKLQAAIEEHVKPLVMAFEERRASEMLEIRSGLAKIEEAVHTLKPDYVPEYFRAGEFNVDTSKAEPVMVTNADKPEGGPVDPATLDPEKLLEMDASIGLTSDYPGDPNG